MSLDLVSKIPTLKSQVKSLTQKWVIEIHVCESTDSHALMWVFFGTRARFPSESIPRKPPCITVSTKQTQTIDNVVVSSPTSISADQNEEDFDVAVNFTTLFHRFYSLFRGGKRNKMKWLLFSANLITIENSGLSNIIEQFVVWNLNWLGVYCITTNHGISFQ